MKLFSNWINFNKNTRLVLSKICRCMCKQHRCCCRKWSNVKEVTIKQTFSSLHELPTCSPTSQSARQTAGQPSSQRSKQTAVCSWVVQMGFLSFSLWSAPFKVSKTLFDVWKVSSFSQVKKITWDYIIFVSMEYQTNKKDRRKKLKRIMEEDYTTIFSIFLMAFFIFLVHSNIIQKKGSQKVTV